jgi:hypothetical protein
MAVTPIRSDLSAASARASVRLDGGPGGGDDGGMEARMARLESDVEYMKRDIAELKTDVREIRTTDFRLIFGAIIATALGLAALMAGGFGWL